MPKVSVIMTVYNGEKYLEACLKCYAFQTFTDYEMLIMDDGSTDASAAIIRRHAAQDPRIEYFHQENAGRAVAANFLISRSKGKYIARMDVDDLVAPNRLSEQVAYLDAHPDVDLVTSGVAHFSDRGRILFAICPQVRSRKSDDEILSGCRNTLVHGSVMVRAKKLKEFSMPYRTRYGQDYDLWIRCLAKGWKFATVPKILYFYRKGSELQENDVKNAIREGQRKAAVRLLAEGRLFDDESCLKEYSRIAESVDGQKYKRRFSFVAMRWVYDIFGRYFWYLHPECVRARVYDALFGRRGVDYLKYRELKKLELPVA